jgi:hypothetical protein
MLNVIMLNVIRLNFVVLNVVILSVLVPIIVPITKNWRVVNTVPGALYSAQHNFLHYFSTLNCTFAVVMMK